MSVPSLAHGGNFPQNHMELPQNSDISQHLTELPRNASLTPQMRAAARHVRCMSNLSGTAKATCMATSSPLTVAIFVAWVLALLAGLALNVLGDVFQSQERFPLFPTVITGIGMNTICACISIVMGCITCDEFVVYQPFLGGRSFVVMQAFGYAINTVAGVVLFIYVVQLQAPEFRYGLISLMATFDTAANTMLVSSLIFFIPPSRVSLVHRRTRSRFSAIATHQGLESALTATEDLESFLRSLAKAPSRECMIVGILALMIFAVSFVGERLPLASYYCLCVGMGLHVLCGFAIHVVIGWHYTPGYQLLMPLMTGVRFGVLQLIGWILYFVSIALGWTLMKSNHNWPQLTYLAFGLCSTTSLLLLLLFTRVTRFTAAITRKGQISEYGSALLTITSTLFATVSIACSLLLSMDHWVEEYGERIRGGMLHSLYLCALSLYLMPPCTHLMGRVAFGSVYEIWQPFKGPLGYLMLQCVGWVCYLSSFIFVTMQVTSPSDYRFIVLQSSLLALSQFVIHASLKSYSPFGFDLFLPSNNCSSPMLPGHTTSFAFALSTPRESGSHHANELSPLQEPHLSDASEDSDDGEGRLVVARVLNGEMITSFAATIVAIIMRSICDVALMSGGSIRGARAASAGESTVVMMDLPLDLLLLLSTLLTLIVTPIAHFSGRDRGIEVLKPFTGSGGYVAFQAIGWTIYAIVLLLVSVDGVRMVSGVSDTEDLILSGSFRFLSPDPHAGDALCVVPQPAAFDFFLHTREGLLMVLPYVLIVMSIVFETRATSERQLQKKRERQEVMELVRVLRSAIQHEEDRKYAEELLRAIAGPKWLDPPVSEGTRLLSENVETARARQEAASLIVSILSAASIMVFLLAASWSFTDNVFAIVFGCAGFLLTGVSCFSVHYMYGTFLHRASGKYTFFMPFSGGSTFVALQAIGWGLFSAMTVLVFMCCVERRSSYLLFLTGGVFSVGSQLMILGSVPRFDPTSESTFFEENSEGFVSFLVLAGAFTFGHVYEMHRSNVATTADLSGMVPLIVTAVAVSFAIPLAVVALKRSATSLELFGNPADATPIDGGYESFFGSHYSSPINFSRGHTTPRGASDASGASRPTRDVAHRHIASFFAVLTLISVAVMGALPAIFVYAVYYYLKLRYRLFAKAMFSYNVLVIIVTATLGLVLLMSAFMNQRYCRWKRRLLEFLSCSFMYSVPTIVVGTNFLLPYFYPTRGTITFCLTNLILVVAAGSKTVRFLLFGVNVGCLGFFLYSHTIHLLYEWNSFSFAPMVADILFTSIWFWYGPRYQGNPQASGRLRNRRYIQFMRDTCIRFSASYLSLRVIADFDTAELLLFTPKSTDESTPSVPRPSRLKLGPKVDLSQPGNQYLFSFHPHGVFPGSCMIATHTDQWDQAVGKSHGDSFVAIHAANVIFNTIGLRDYVMGLGTLVVTRQAIKGNLERGNSSIVITGGQSEMLHTSFSETELHLITHHMGFLRLAIQTQTPLVPLLSFGENNLMNFIHWTKVQKAMLRLMGFPFPLVPFGAFYLPLPCRTPLTMVVGQPILIPEGASEHDEELVAELSQVYFDCLEKLFYKYREAAGYPNMRLVLHHKPVPAATTMNKGGGADPSGTVAAHPKEEAIREGKNSRNGKAWRHPTSLDHRARSSAPRSPPPKALQGSLPGAPQLPRKPSRHRRMTSSVSDYVPDDASRRSLSMSNSSRISDRNTRSTTPA